MHVDPALRAFASDKSGTAGAQGRILAAHRAWRGRANVARVVAECARLAAGANFDDCLALTALMDEARALAFVQDWLAAMGEAWRADPLAQLPFRHSYSVGVGAIHLCRTGAVTLALLVVEPRAAVRPTTIAFTDCERCEIVLAGRGRGLAFRFADSRPPEAEPFALAPGVQMACDADRSRAFVSLDEPLVLLRLARDPLQAMPTREVEIATGRIVHRASASPAEGRAELAAALLGAMERADAAPALADFACGKTGGCGQASEGPRWQALRNALALDTEAGFAALCALADRPGDPLAPQARALRKQLCTSYPQLADKVPTPCLAS